MDNQRVKFAGLSLILPDEWFDVTDDLEEGAPFTLGKGANALGALQFSVGHYASGKLPNIDMDNLSSLFFDFIAKNDLGNASKIEKTYEDTLSISGDFVTSDEFIRLWYATDKKNIALITYVSTLPEDPSLSKEVAEADQIVKSIVF
jgi:hypothetical protein